MRGFAEVRAVCVVGKRAGEWIPAAAFFTGGCCTHAERFAATLECTAEVWFVEKNDEGEITLEKKIRTIENDPAQRQARNKRLREISKQQEDLEEELRELRRKM